MTMTMTMKNNCYKNGSSYAFFAGAALFSTAVFILNSDNPPIYLPSVTCMAAVMLCYSSHIISKCKQRRDASLQNDESTWVVL